MWVDNTPSSPHYGRAYVSWNNYALGNQPIQVVYSDNGGTTWTAATTVYSAAFIRNVQITTGPDGRVFIAGMNEGGGGLTGPRTNMMFYSDNGTTWTTVTMGGTFLGPGVATCGYFAAMFSTGGGYWRHMGRGDVGGGPSGIIHYAYAQHGAGSDPGDIYYTRSTNNGATWSTPLRLDGDTGTRAQWQPSLSATPDGHLLASWYDARNTTGNSFERWGRISTNNGSTWDPPSVISDVVSPLPLQPDPGIQACYTGDYDRSYGNNAWFNTTWVDGRVAINGTNQQDVFFDRI